MFILVILSVFRLNNVICHFSEKVSEKFYKIAILTKLLNTSIILIMENKLWVTQTKIQ